MEDAEDVVLLNALVVVVISVYLLIARSRHRSCGVRFINRQRSTMSEYNYFKKMKENDPSQFFKYTRMNTVQFDKLLKILSPHLLKSSRNALSPQHRLAITLR
jgi:hypothetical protein